MTINEASKRFHISMERLKNYEENGLLEHQTLVDGAFDYTETSYRLGRSCTCIMWDFSMSKRSSSMRFLGWLSARIWA